MRAQPVDQQTEFLERLGRSRASRSNGVPLYLQAARAIQGLLSDHVLPVETPLPAEHELAAALGISRPTLRQALAQLARDGLIYTQRGKGTFPAPTALSRPARLSSLHEDLRAAGLDPHTRVLELTRVPADDETAADLHLEHGAELLQITRLRSAGDNPVAVIHNLLALGDAPALTTADLESRGLYDLLHSHYGIELGMGSQRVSARLATPQERELLALPDPSAVLVARRLSFDTQGRGVEKSATVYPEGTEIASAQLLP